MKDLIQISLFAVVFAAMLASCTGGNGYAKNAQEAKNDSSKIDTTVKVKAENDSIYSADKDTVTSSPIDDKARFTELMAYAKANNLSSKSIPEIEIEVAKQLLGIPYVAFTLENDSVEQLVVNLHGLDCTTFVENVVALSLTIKSDSADFATYCKHLTTIRYRNGKIDKYPSRLHYFTDWLMDNQKKGIVQIISNQYGDSVFDPTVFFMSKNPDRYKKLKNKPEFVKQIAQAEKRISAAEFKYFTPKGLEKNTDKIQNGDIIGFATTKAGLDISHVAIAYFKDGKLHFYHASYTKKKVVLSEDSMIDYLKKIKSNNGVVVARINYK